MNLSRRSCLVMALVVLLVACQSPPASEPTAAAASTHALPPAPAASTTSEQPRSASEPDVLSPTPEPPEPTRTPVPTATPAATFAAPPGLNTIYGQGVIPLGAIARLGLGSLHDWQLSPDGRLLAIGTSVGVYVFETSTMQQVWARSMVRWVQEVEWSPDGHWLATRLFEWGNVHIWDAWSGEMFRELQNDSQVRSIGWSPDSMQMVIGLGSYSSEDLYDSKHAVTAWDLETTQQLWFEEIDEALLYYDPVRAVVWSPRDGVIAVGVDNAVLLLNAATGEVLDVLENPDTWDAFSEMVRFSPDGSMVASVSGICCLDTPGGSRVAPVFDVASGSLLYSFEHRGIVVDAVWAPDGNTLIVWSAATFDRSIPAEVSLWDTRSGALIYRDGDGQLSRDSVRWSADGSQFIATEQGTGQLIVWNARTGEHVPAGFDFPDISSFAATSYVGPLHNHLLIWDVQAGAPRYVFESMPPPDRIAWSPDQSHIAVERMHNDYYDLYPDFPLVVSWNIQTRAPSQVDGGSDWIRDSGQVDTEYGGECLIDASQSMPYDNSLAVDFDILLGSGDRRRQTTIDVQRGSTEFTITEASEIAIPCTAAFSPDGRFLAIGHGPLGRGVWGLKIVGLDQSIVTVYDLITGALVYEFRGHTGSVHKVVWSPDGTLLATASWDGTILVWRVGPP